jgi:hypothetical protein
VRDKQIARATDNKVGLMCLVSDALQMRLRLERRDSPLYWLLYRTEYKQSLAYRLVSYTLPEPPILVLCYIDVFRENYGILGKVAYESRKLFLWLHINFNSRMRKSFSYFEQEVMRLHARGIFA